MRVRDVVADSPNIFEIQKLEHLKDAREMTKSDDRNGLIMRLECDS